MTGNGTRMPSGMPNGSMSSSAMRNAPIATGNPSSVGESGTGNNTYGAATPEDNTTFLRGWQFTDENGIVKIETIYPGWYAGRALHIHVNVFTPKTVFPNGTYATDAIKLHTGQIFFNVISPH